MKFPYFSNLLFIPYQKMITKRETSTCVTNVISFELIYENLQKGKCMFKDTSLKGCSSPKERKAKAKV
jgi:hypothetical protein